MTVNGLDSSPCTRLTGVKRRRGTTVPRVSGVTSRTTFGIGSVLWTSYPFPPVPSVYRSVLVPVQISLADDMKFSFRPLPLRRKLNILDVFIDH